MSVPVEGTPSPGQPRLTLAEIHRRPSGAPPPLPKEAGWLRWAVVFLVVLLVGVAIDIALRSADGIQSFDQAVLRWFADLRTDGFTSLAKALYLPTSLAFVLIVRWVVVIALAAVGRFRHMVVFLATFVISDWLVARKDLLKREKELTRLRDQLSAERRALPWVKIDKEYIFDAPEGKVTLADLFAGRSQLFIKHFMMGPGQATQCVGCSLEVDHLEGILVHLQNHDVSYAVVARAPIEEIEAMRRRMGWKFPFVSSYNSEFNYDFNVSFTREDVASGRTLYNFSRAPEWAAEIEDLSGDSVFYKDEAGQILHTYSTFGRGGEEFLGIYRILDVMPKGRDENGPYRSLADWARPRNMYGKGGSVEPNGRYHEPACAGAIHQSAAA